MDIELYKKLTLDEKLYVCRCLIKARDMKHHTAKNVVMDGFDPHPGNLIFIEDIKIKHAINTWFLAPSSCVSAQNKVEGWYRMHSSKS